MVDLMLSDWIKIGRNIDDYEDLTIAEMMYQIMVRKEGIKEARQVDAQLALFMAQQTTIGYHSPNKVTTLTREKAFPELFKKSEAEMQTAFLNGVMALNERKKGG